MSISVVIPAYNCAAYLKACVESFLTQTRKPHEIIVVDDGSTDNLVEIAASLPVRLIRHTANQGLNAARQTGLRSVAPWAPVRTP